jgi:PAS domain-containing protein
MKSTSFNRWPGMTDLLELKQVHDTVWMMSLLAVVAGMVITARLGLNTVEPGDVLPGFLVYVVLYTLAKEALRRVQDHRLLGLSVRGLHLTGVFFLGFLWLEAGGPRAPGFLLVFALPIVAGTGLMLPGHNYLTALVSIAVVSGVSVASSPDLRSRFGLPPGFGSPLDWTTAQLLGLIVTFGVAQMALALSSSSLVTVVDRLNLRLSASSRALENVRTLFQAVLRATPVPEVLLHAPAGRVIHASDAFTIELGKGKDADRSLFELVSFDEEREIREAIAARRPAEILTTFRLGGQKRIGNVVLFPIRYEGDDYVHLSLREEADLYLRLAIDALDAALVVSDAEKRIAYFNSRAAELFGSLRRGGPIDPLLNALGLPRVYLDLLSDDRTQTEAELGGIDYVVATSMIARPDLGRLALIVVRPAKRAGTGEILNPLTLFHAPRYFTEAASRYLAAPNRKGSFALLELETSGEELEDLVEQARFVSVVERLLRPEDLFLGLRQSRFGLLAPASRPSEVSDVLEQAKEIALGGDASNRGSKQIDVHHSVVEISGADDLDSLMRRAAEGLPLPVGRGAL